MGKRRNEKDHQGKEEIEAEFKAEEIGNGGDDDEIETYQKASDEVLKTRRIYNARGWVCLLFC